MAGLRTLRAIIEGAWADSGRKGPAPIAFIRKWRQENVAYGKWRLTARFASGSEMPYQPADFASDADEIATTPTPALKKLLDREREMLAFYVSRNEMGPKGQPEYPAECIAGKRALVAEIEHEFGARAGDTEPAAG